jgi:hypothetical protein
MASVFWVLVAARLPSLVIDPIGPLPSPSPSPSPSPTQEPRPTPTSVPMPHDVLVQRSERLLAETRALEKLLRNEPCHLNRARAIRKLEEILDDLESKQCKI